MQTDIQDGKSIDSLLEQAISGHYAQPDWDIHSVFQTNEHFFQSVLKDFRDEIKSESQETDLEFYKRRKMDGNDKCRVIHQLYEIQGWIGGNVLDLLPASLKAQEDAQKYWFEDKR